MNLYALLSVGFVQLNKITVNEKKASALDLIFIVNASTIIVTTPIIIFSRNLSFIIPKESRKIFFSRAFEGWLLIVVYIIGNTLIPITVQQTLTNTTPFWAALLAYCFINESISKLEALAMIVSFGAVILITVS